MAEKNKRGFHTVEEPDMEEYERKLREHRVKVVRRTVILIVTVLAVSAGLWVFMALRHYENFDVGSSVDRADNRNGIRISGGRWKYDPGVRGKL